MPLLEAVSRSIQGWQNITLSYMGRIEFIRSVLMGKILYWITSFLLPQSVIARLTQLLTRFLWSGQDKRGVHKVAWKDVCQPKEEGGLGLRCIATLNKACLMRYIWAIASKKDSLWVKWMNSRYLLGNSIWSFPTPASCSWCLRSILQVVHPALQCTRHLIGDGRDTLLWLDPWHPRGLLYHLPGRMEGDVDPYRMAPVSVIRRGSTWRKGYSHSTLINAIWGLINSIDDLQEGRDVIVWIASKSGLYTLKFAYNHLKATGDVQNWHHLAWFKGAIPRFSFITWLLFRGRLPTLDRLFQWGVVQNPTCHLCSQTLETSQHLFFECSYSFQVWTSILSKCLLVHTPAGWDSEQVWAEAALSGVSVTCTIRKIALTAAIYYIWAERNNRAHNVASKPPNRVISQIITAVRCRLLFLFPQVQECANNADILGSWDIPYRGKQIIPIWTVWPKPAPNYTAINTDASIRDGKAGTGWIIRNHQGSPIMAAASAVAPAVESILYYELQAIHGGLASALKYNFLHATIQSDSQTAIDIISGKAKPPWKCWCILSRINAIRSKFHDVNFIFVYREANQPADFLSHFGRTIEEEILWPTNFPLELQALIQRDRTQSPHQRR